MDEVRPRPRVRAAATVSVALTALLAVTACSATNTGNKDNDAESSSPVSIPATNGPGVTDTTITLSWSAIARSGQLPAAVRKQQDKAMNAVVTAFNTQGGIAGRKVVILTDDPGTALIKQRQDAYKKSQGLPVPDPTNGQAACDAYAKADDPVFALLASDLVSAPLGTPAAGACLNKAGHPVISASAWTRADYRAAPATAGLSLSSERWIDALTAAGKDAGFLDKTPAKTALITDSTATTDIVDSVYRPALAKAGVTHTEVYPVSPTSTQAQALNVALKLKSAGVKRLIYLTPSATTAQIAGALIPVMQQQTYFPKQLLVGGSPLNNPQIKFVPKMMQAISAYDWARQFLQPDPAQLAITNATPAGKLCAAAAKADPAGGPSISIALCDQLEVLKAALSASGSKYVNAQAFTVGLGKLGAKYSSPQLFATSFRPGDHDGAAGLAREVYSDDCHCAEPDSHVIEF